MKHLLFISILLCGLGCKNTSECVENVNPACSCILIYDPVCGCNNKTYSNSCMAECSGITTYSKGECPGKQAPASLEGTSWRLMFLTEAKKPQQAVPEDVIITLEFSNGKISGNGGCNRYSGSYSAQSAALQMSNVTSTKMACSALAWEDKYFQLIPKSQSYTVTDNTLTVKCGETEELVFQKN